MNDEKVHEIVKKIFSGELASHYPTKAEGDKYQKYKEKIGYGCGIGHDVLELACGTGKYFHLLPSKINLHCLDISLHMLARAYQNSLQYPFLASFSVQAIENFDLSRKFDFIFCIGTLGEYCRFDKEVLDHILSYLRPKGFLFFTVVDSEKYSEQGKDFDWSKFYMTKAELETIMKPLPFRYSIESWTDNKCTHHICSVWNF